MESKTNQSVGRAREALLLALGGIILVKLPVLLVAARLFSLTGIWAAEAISELILCLVSIILLRKFQGTSDATWQHEHAR